MSAPPYPVSNPQQMAGGFSGTLPPGSAPPYQGPGPAALPTSKVEIRVSCRSLKNMDVFSKSDPMVVLSMEKTTKTQKVWVEIGRTEVIKDCLNPDFVTPFQLDYRFEEIQKLRFSVYDQDTSKHNLDEQDYLGFCECHLGSLVGECRGKVEKPVLNGKQQNGTIILVAEEMGTCRETYTFQLRGRKLDKKDFFGLSDPFLIFNRCNEDGTYTAVHKSEIVKNSLNPVWKPFKIHGRTLCNGDEYRSIKIECYDWDRDGGHDLIGTCTTNAHELKEKRNSCSFELINEKKAKKKKGYKNSGSLDLMLCEIVTESTFLDYVHAGLELCFSVAVDFTASNGEPNLPSSLHFQDMYTPNQYVQAIGAVGTICQDYDTDKLFPAFGFGARVPPTYQTMHQFSLTGNNDPHCFGVQGILDAYYRSIQAVQLYGPTNFAPVIRSTSELAANSSTTDPGKRYFILLIITDGIITDMELTKGAIVDASSLPMSIIIIGVGTADFSAMEELDGDDVRVSYRGKYAERDIVQFVPFRDFAGRGAFCSPALASEVLAELPGQITLYMKTRGFKV